MNYGQLRQAIIETVESDEAALVAAIPRFVRTAEETILKTVRLNEFKRNAQGNTSPNNPFLAVPIDFLATFALNITLPTGRRAFLEQKDVSFLREFAAPEIVGTPRFYAHFDVDNFLLAPTPASVFPAEINYFYRPPSLADGGDTATTWISINAPNTLLYGCLIEAGVFQKSEQDIMQMYQARFVQSLERLKHFGEALETTDNFRYGQIRKPRN